MLPTELLEKICSHTKDSEWRHLMTTSRQFSDIVTSDRFLRERLMHDDLMVTHALCSARPHLISHMFQKNTLGKKNTYLLEQERNYSRRALADAIHRGDGNYCFFLCKIALDVLNPASKKETFPCEFWTQMVIKDVNGDADFKKVIFFLLRHSKAILSHPSQYDDFAYFVCKHGLKNYMRFAANQPQCVYQCLVYLSRHESLEMMQLYFKAYVGRCKLTNVYNTKYQRFLKEVLYSTIYTPPRKREIVQMMIDVLMEDQVSVVLMEIIVGYLASDSCNSSIKNRLKRYFAKFVDQLKAEQCLRLLNLCDASVLSEEAVALQKQLERWLETPPSRKAILTKCINLRNQHFFFHLFDTYMEKQDKLPFLYDLSLQNQGMARQLFHRF